MSELALRPMADAFMQVGVYVAVLIAAFGWLRWRHGDQLLRLLRRRRWAPAVGAVLGVSPGCAGAILVMPLYARGTVSFGAVVAALVATMGDSSWVVMAADPAAAAQIHAILLAAGLVTGYAVDALGIRPRLRSDAAGGSPASARPARALGTAPAATPAVTPLRARGATGAVSVGTSATVFWALTAAGFLVSVPVVFQVVAPQALSGAFGGVDPYLWLGSAGTVVAFAVFATGRGKPADDSMDTARATGRTEPFTAVLRHGARETSFVVVWVAAIYLAWSLVHHLTGFDGSQLPLAGLAGVVIGAAIGLIPGCAVQIVFTGLYVAGVVPFSTLIANALSQDGDALLPLLAFETRSAVTATCITTLPGLLVGGLALVLT